MRKVTALLLVLGLIFFSANVVSAQDPGAEEMPDDTSQVAEEQPVEEEVAPPPPPPPSDDEAEDSAPKKTGFQMLKEKFIEGNWIFMSFVLVCLILGLAFCIERIITLNIATTNTDKLLARIDDNLKNGDVEGAMEVCKSTPGPTASILFEGLKNADKGPDAVEKAIVSYGSVQMGLLEKGLVWISLFIAIAPMLGFMGTVIGMIGAFDAIQVAGDISPNIVAGGIKVALLTTVFGLIVAIILQIFYNYIVSKIDGIVNRMEDASVALVEIMASNNVFK
jgi:biopolymer transport protein ExbB